MKVTGVRSTRLVGPRPHSLGGEEGRFSTILIRVDSDEGVYGLGEAEDFFGVREAIAYLGTVLVGRDPLAIRPFLSEMLYGTLPPHPPAGGQICSPTATPTGPIIWGLSGVEMALCDLAGKLLNTPAYNLLGGAYRDRVRIYLDRSSPHAVEDLDAWKRMAAATIDEGFRHLKFDIDFTAPDQTEDVWNRSIPARQMNRIVERISAVRDTVGPDVELCVDGHMHYNVPDAIRLANELAPLRLLWFEDPTPITSPESCASVRAKSPIPICVGEMFIAEQVRLFIDQGACDIIHPDILFCGGLHELRKIADYAELHHIPVAMHGNGGALATIAAAHVAASSRTFLGLEYHFIEAQWVGEFVQREGVPLFADGYLPLTDAPGLGVELDVTVCERYLAPGESPIW